MHNLDLLTWEVNVCHDGIKQPTLTLRIDEKLFSPRKKKKKTLWKLPNSFETLLKLGEQDKRHILELFCEKKKELKKLKNKQRAYRKASLTKVMNNSGRGVDKSGRDFNLNGNRNS